MKNRSKVLSPARIKANSRMEKVKNEIRTVAQPPMWDEESRKLSGYAIVYDVDSRVLWDFCGGEFVETIDRGAVSPELLATSDVVALFDHEGMLLARSVNGEGTLSLVSDDHGLHFEFVVPNTSRGNDVAELVRRGDLRGCSFAFAADEADIIYTTRADGTRHRRVMKISRLADISVVTNPAYTQTSVSLRSFGEVPEEKKGDNKTTLSLAEAAKRRLNLLIK